MSFGGLIAHFSLVLNGTSLSGCTSLPIYLLKDISVACLQVLAVMNKAIITVTFFTMVHSFYMDSISKVKSLQDVFLKVIASGNIWVQSLSSSVCPV